MPLFSSYVNAGSENNASSGVLKHFHSAYVQGLTDSTGIAIRYESSVLVHHLEESVRNDLARNVHVGMRLRNVKIINQSDGVMIRLQKLVKPDSKFRLLVFPGDISRQREAQRLRKLGEELSSLTFSCAGEISIDAYLEVITIHAAKRADIELLDLHEVFHPWSDEGGWDYWKVYADDASWHEGDCNAYKTLGIGMDGCMMLLRPDGYVSLLCSMGDVGPISRFLAGLMKTAPPSKS